MPLTVTYTLDGMVGQPLVIANSAETTLILYGQYAIGEYKINAEDGDHQKPGAKRPMVDSLPFGS